LKPPKSQPFASAVLLMDLQHDFLAPDGRMPVAPEAAVEVIKTANAILAKTVLPEVLPVVIVNQFPATDRVANWFRKGAAVAGSPGAELDDRIQDAGGCKVFSKCSSSAFSNPELQPFLQAQGIRRLYVLGVFAEGCVRATVLDALKLGYEVTVIEDAIATDAPWKKRFAVWAMKRAGAAVVPQAGFGD
jgi:nicotinamidase-related amidase